MSAHLEIYERTIRYGYIFWKKCDDLMMLKAIKGLENKKVEVVINKVSIGKKTLDLAHRRISIGTKVSRGLIQGQKLKIIKNLNRIEVTF